MTGNPVVYELYSALAASNSNIYFEVKVRIEYANNLSWADSITIPAYPASGIARVDIKDILDSLLTYDLPAFNVNEKLSTTATRQSAYFYIQFRELIPDGGDPSFDDSESEYPKTIIKAGMSYMTYRGDNFWENYFNTDMPFLTWQRSGRLAALDERMYLGFLLNFDLPSWSIPEVVGPTLWQAMQVFYTDGTSSSVQYAEISGNWKNAISFIPCGATQWSLASLAPAKKIWYWKTRIEYTSANDGTKTALNAWFLFYADNRNDYNKLTLHYRNSLGCIDSVRVLGVIEKALNYSFDQQARTFLADYFSGDSITPALIIANSKEDPIFKGDAGYQGKENQERLRDMNLQRDLWWEVNEKWWPMKLLTASFKMKTTEDNLWSFPIEFGFAIEGDRFYTPDIDLGDRTFDTNVCSATIAAIVITVDTSDVTASISVTFTRDPTTVAQYSYKVVGFHTDPIVANFVDLPLVVTGLTKELNYTLELRPICAGGIIGRKFIAAFNTIGAGGGGGGGGGKNMFLINETAATLDIKIDGVNPYTFGSGVNGNVVITNSGTLQNNSGAARRFKFLISLPSSIIDNVVLNDGDTYNFPADVSFYNYVRVTIP